MLVVPYFAALCEAELSWAEGGADSDRWQAVAALWDGLPNPYDAAYARFREAEALLAAKDPRPHVEQALRAAYQTAERLGAVPLRREIELLRSEAASHWRNPSGRPSPSRRSALGGHVVRSHRS